ncbi:MAG TPA: DUF4157 domain-containing protein [Bradyrhizobium sp.]
MALGLSSGRIGAAIATAAAPRANNTGLPDHLKSGVETLSGLGMDDVRVHFNSSRPAQLQALATTQGADIHIGPGQEGHLPHEAWHVVQQKQGRVGATLQMKGVAINDDAGLEREADTMGARAAQTEPAGARPEPALPFHGGAIQRKPTSTRTNTETVTLRVGRTGAYTYVINGTATQNKNAVPAQGAIRYVRTDGVADCIAVAMQGTRADGTVVSLLAHLSGKDYLVEARKGLPADPYTTEAYWHVANFAQGLNNVRSIAVTTYQRPPFDIVAALKPGLQAVPLRNVDPFTAGGGDFILDTEQFDLHKAGRVNRLQEADIGASVSEAMTQSDFQKKYPPPKKANVGLQLQLLLVWLAIILFIAAVVKVVSLFPSSSKAEPQPKGPPVD